MLHPLPPRPGEDTPAPLPPLSLLSEAGPSRPARTSGRNPDTTECEICGQPPKYTCPRCEKRTCSLACTKTHKAQDECSGTRDPTSYVPLNAVGHASWGDDYKWLEEGRRKVADWGEGITAAEAESLSSRGGSARGRGRGGAMNKVKRAAGTGREALQAELQRRGVGLKLMPEGMDRRKKNQSSWNPKYVKGVHRSRDSFADMSLRTQTLNLTIQVTLSPNTLRSIDAGDNGKPPASTTIHSRVLFASTSQTDLPTLESLLPPSIQAEQHVIAMMYTPQTTNRDVDTNAIDGPSALPSKSFFPPFEANQPLQQVLKGTTFVEYPTAEVYTKSEWNDRIAEGSFSILPLQEIPESRARDSGWGAKRTQANMQESTQPAQPSIQADTLASSQVVEPEVKRARVDVPAPPTSLGLGLDYGSDEDSDADS